MSEAEDPKRATQQTVTVEDVRELMGASTPHFALQLRNRIKSLVAELPDDSEARIIAEREILRLDQLAFTGETRGEGAQPDQRALPSLGTSQSDGG